MKSYMLVTTRSAIVGLLMLPQVVGTFSNERLVSLTPIKTTAIHNRLVPFLHSGDNKYLRMSLEELLQTEIPSSLSKYSLGDLLSLSLADLLAMKVDDARFDGKDFLSMSLVDILEIDVKSYKSKPEVQEYLAMSLNELLNFRVSNPRLKHLTLEDLLQMPMSDLLAVRFGDSAADKDLRDLLQLRLEEILDLSME